VLLILHAVIGITGARQFECKQSQLLHKSLAGLWRMVGSVRSASFRLHDAQHPVIGLLQPSRQRLQNPLRRGPGHTRFQC